MTKWFFVVVVVLFQTKSKTHELKKNVSEEEPAQVSADWGINLNILWRW